MILKRKRPATFRKVGSLSEIDLSNICYCNACNQGCPLAFLSEYSKNTCYRWHFDDPTIREKYKDMEIIVDDSEIQG